MADGAASKAPVWSYVGLSMLLVGLVLTALFLARPQQLWPGLNAQALQLPVVPLALTVLGAAAMLARLRTAFVWLARVIALAVLAASVLAFYPVAQEPWASVGVAFQLWEPLGPSLVESFLAGSAVWIVAGTLVLLIATVPRLALVAEWLALSFVASGVVITLAFVFDPFTLVSPALVALFNLFVLHACCVEALHLSLSRSEFLPANGAPRARRFLVRFASVLPFVALVSALVVHVWPGRLLYPPHAVALVTVASLFVAAVAAVAAITKREAALRAALGEIGAVQQDARNAEAAGGFGTWRLDRASGTLLLSEAAAQILRTDARRTDRDEFAIGVTTDHAEALARWYASLDHCVIVRRDDRWVELCAGGETDSAIVTGTVRDVTDEVARTRTKDEELDLLCRVAEKTPDYVFVYDVVAQEYVYANRPLGGLFGRPGYQSNTVMRDSVLDEHRDALLAHIQTVNDSHDDSVHEVEFKARHADGGTVWVRNRASVYRRDEGGRPTHVTGTAQDVTELREVMRRLEDYEARFERICARTPGVIYQFAITAAGEMSFPFVSSSAVDLFGRTAEEMQDDASTAFSMVHEEDRADLFERIEVSHRDLSDFSWVGRINRDDGRTIWIQAWSRPTRHEDGSTVWDGVTMDVTEAKEAQLALQETKERLDYVLSESPTVVYSCEPTAPYRVTFVAANIRRLIGFVPEQIVGRPLFGIELIHRADHALFRLHERRFIDHGRSTAEYRMKTISGDYVWVRDDVHIVSQRPEHVEAVGTWTDVTDLRRSMEKTLASEARLQRLASRAKGMLFELVFVEEDRLRFSYVSPGSFELVGVPPDELVARPESFLFMFDEGARDSLYRELARSQADLTELKWEGELRLPDGRAKYVSIEARPTELDGGVSWSGIATDAGDLAGLKDALRESEMRFEAFVNSSSEAVLVADVDGIVVGANPRAEALFGRLSHDLVGRLVSEISTGLSLSADAAGQRRRARIHKSDGTSSEVEVTVVVFAHEGERRYAGLISQAAEQAQSSAAVEMPEMEQEPSEPPSMAEVLVLAPQARLEEIRQALTGYSTRVAATAGSGLELAKRRPPELLLVVDGLPDATTESVVEATTSDPDLGSVPVLVLGAAPARAARLARLGATVVEGPDVLEVTLTDALSKRAAR